MTRKSYYSAFSLHCLLRQALPTHVDPSHALPTHTLPAHLLPTHTLPPLGQADPAHADKLHTLPAHADPPHTLPPHALPPQPDHLHALTPHPLAPQALKKHVLPVQALPRQRLPPHPLRTQALTGLALAGVIGVTSSSDPCDISFCSLGIPANCFLTWLSLIYERYELDPSGFSPDTEPDVAEVSKMLTVNNIPIKRCFFILLLLIS